MHKQSEFADPWRAPWWIIHTFQRIEALNVAKTQTNWCVYFAISNNREKRLEKRFKSVITFDSRPDLPPDPSHKKKKAGPSFFSFLYISACILYKDCLFCKENWR